ncbi:MAG: nucleotidyltransferase domain-containing protein [Chloroflexota bacterium]
MLEMLSDRPRIQDLERFLKLMMDHRNDLEFVVLFGSMAHGNWTRSSDYDVLVGLQSEDGQRIIDRMTAFDQYVQGNIEVFPYARSEWQRMISQYHPLYLDALDYGIVLLDRGRFADLRQQFLEWKRDGVVEPLKHGGWRINIRGDDD